MEHLQACRNRASQSRAESKVPPQLQDSPPGSRDLQDLEGGTCGDIYAPQHPVPYRKHRDSVGESQRLERTMGWRMHIHNNHKRSTGSRLQLRCECDLTGRFECGPARYKRSVVALRQLGPLQASDEHSTQVPECGELCSSVDAAFTETTEAGWWRVRAYGAATSQDGP